MKRHEIIFALRKYCHPSWFQKILGMEDDGLAVMLFYYENGGTSATVS